jgi:hypothetical protein
LDERQRRLIEDAHEAHREAQVHGRPVPERLVEKWSSEVGIEKPKDIEQETPDQ